MPRLQHFEDFDVSCWQDGWTGQIWQQQKEKLKMGGIPGCDKGSSTKAPETTNQPQLPLEDMTDAQRKGFPIGTGVLDYFPDALLAVAAVSKAGNDQHNPGQPLHWSKGKSTDHDNCLQRHFLSRGTLDKDGGRHSAKLAWRALARLQIEIEAERAHMTYQDYVKRLEADAAGA